MGAENNNEKGEEDVGNGERTECITAFDCCF